MPDGTRPTLPAPLVSLVGYSLSVTIEDGGYVKAYASPPDGAGIVSYGCQGRISDGIVASVRQLVEEWIEANDA